MKIVFTPDWFLTNDVLIEMFSFAILLFFFFFAFKSYKVSRKKSVLFLGVGFLLIAMGELSTIMTKLVLYYDTLVTKEIGQAVITYHIVKSVDIFYYIGFFFNRFLTLLGLYVIYKTPERKNFSQDFILILYLIFAVSFSMQADYPLYNFTAFVLLVPIIRNYYKIYKKQKLSNTKILIFAFALLALSHLIFVFSEINSLFYALAQSIKLVSYIILLVLIVKIKKWKGKGTE